MARARIGTSGWQYDDWKARFYPADLAKTRWLAHYAAVFDTVEVNGTFYSLPKTETVAAWRDSVGADFVFAYKASRYLSHIKRLKDAEQPLEKLAPVAETLGDTAGPMLVQLPPNWNVNPERFADFTAKLPEGRRVAYEFRDESWFCEAIYERIRARGDALVITDISGTPSPDIVTGDFTYLRLHGPDQAYRGSYADGDIDAWADWIAARLAGGVDVYCYFDNDHAAAAPQDAQRLKERVAARTE